MNGGKRSPQICIVYVYVYVYVCMFVRACVDLCVYVGPYSLTYAEE